MTTSGSIDFSVSRDDLIKAALQHIVAISEGDTPNSDQLTECALLLNLIVKMRMADGMPLWALKTGYILPTTDVSSINLGGTGGHATLSYVETALSAAAASAASTITVDSITGISNSDYIGIELSDNSMQWTTINGAPSGSTITLTTALTGAASNDAQVFTYTTKLQRPLKIIKAYRYDVVNDIRTEIESLSKYDLLALSSVTSESYPYYYAYDPQLTDGIFYFYPRFNTGDYILQVTFHRPFEDFDGAADTPDFPQEWYLPIMLELAAIIGPKYGVTLKERLSLFAEAKAYRDEVLGFSSDNDSIRIVPDTRHIK